MARLFWLPLLILTLLRLGTWLIDLGVSIKGNWVFLSCVFLPIHSDVFGMEETEEGNLK
jgi:hypothetical protein